MFYFHFWLTSISVLSPPTPLCVGISLPSWTGWKLRSLGPRGSTSSHLTSWTWWTLPQLSLNWTTSYRRIELSLNADLTFYLSECWICWSRLEVWRIFCSDGPWAVMAKWVRGGGYFAPSSHGHLDKIIVRLIAFFPMRLLKNLSLWEESVFHELKPRISSIGYDIERNVEMESPRTIRALNVCALLGLVPYCLPGCSVWVSEETEQEKHSWSKEWLLAGVDCPVGSSNIKLGLRG